MKTEHFRPEFVEFIPQHLDEGVLYISIPYATAVHLCASGCGERVVTPLTPTDWELIFDGVEVSLSPSIGNWGYACESHYWIDHGKVTWAPAWSKERIELNRSHDRRAKGAYYGRAGDDGELKLEPAPSKQPWWRRLFHLD